jgi:imidazolonepropionase-like amidohydrolase
LRFLLIFALAWMRLCAQDLALVHARIYAGPEALAIPDGTIVVEDGWISAVGPAASVKTPANMRVIDCSGLTAVAGFWNSHVHFTEDKWQNARALPAARMSEQLVDMLARYGFTAVFDTGSDTANTIAMRERIGSAEVAGPMILTAGTPLAPAGGTPYYVKPTLLPEIGSVEEAQRVTRERMNQGVDAI